MTRLVHNHGNPFLGSDGVPVADVELKFELVDSHGKAVTMYDAIDHSIIPVAAKYVTLDANGEFEINLWPNSRGTSASYYRATLALGKGQYYKIFVMEGVGDLAFFDAIWSGETPQPSEVSALSLHLQNHPLGANAVMSMTTAATLNKYDVVVVNPDGRVVQASCQNPLHFQRVLGFAQEAYAAADEASILTYGKITNPAWNLDGNKKVYLGVDGIITQDAPTTGFILCLGFPLNATTIFVDKGSAIAPPLRWTVSDTQPDPTQFDLWIKPI